MGTGAAPALAAGDANSAHCAPNTESSPGFRTYLPDCRAYELVTPPYKAGGTLLSGAAVSDDGEHAIVAAGSAFAGAGNDWWQTNRNPSIDAYELTRTEGGWQPTALTPPATTFPHSAIMAASAGDLSSTLWGAAPTTVQYNEDIYLRNAAGEFSLIGPGFQHDLTGEALTGSSEELEFAGASADLTHSLFWTNAFTAEETSNHHGHSNLWPGDTTDEGDHSLYEYVHSGSPDPEPILVGVSNEGPVRSDAEAHLISSCGTELGSSKAGGSAYNAVSASGETVFFTARSGSGCVTPAVNELYARIAGSRTVAVSEPSKADCEVCQTASGLQKASFAGASQTGEKVFFLTEQELLPGQSGMNLYEYDFAGPEAGPAHPDGKIALLSGGSTAPEVQGVVRISGDGSHVYFAAKGVLTAGKNAEEHEPQAGADNLYVYDTVTGDTAFVATLLTPAEESSIKEAEEEERSRREAVAVETYFAQVSTIEHERERGEISVEREQELLGLAFEEAEAQLESIAHGPGTSGPSGTLAEDESVWSTVDSRPAQATPEGRFLVFPSSAHLTPDDSSGQVPQLFEYDAVSERLTRVSIGQNPTDGNVDTFHESPVIPTSHLATTGQPTSQQEALALSADGSRVLFTSAAPLTPQATTGTTNVYEYREGAIYLISDGQDASFLSSPGESSVRLGGIDPSAADVLFTTADQLVPQDGEPQQGLFDAREEGGFPAPAPTPGCVGETCRGSSAPAPQLPAAASVTQPGTGNVVPLAQSKPAAKHKAKAGSSVRARRLAAALRACRKKPRARRAACVRRAIKSYGAKVRAKNSDRRSGR